MVTSILLFVLSQAARLGSASDHAEQVALTVPKASWIMLVPGDTFDTKARVKPDGTAGYFLLTKDAGGMNLSVFIEPIKNCSTPVACRDWAWKAEQTRLEGIEDVSESEMGDAAVVEYLQPTVGNVKVDQKNIHAYWVKDGYWIDAHISKVAFQEADREQLVRLIRGIEFIRKGDVKLRYGVDWEEKR